MPNNFSIFVIVRVQNQGSCERLRNGSIEMNLDSLLMRELNISKKSTEGVRLWSTECKTLQKAIRVDNKNPIHFSDGSTSKVDNNNNNTMEKEELLKTEMRELDKLMMFIQFSHFRF